MGYYDDDFKYINKFGGAFDLYGAISLSKILNTKSIGEKVKKREGAPEGKLRDFYKCNTNACVATKIYFAYFNMAIADALDGNIIKIAKNGNYPVIRVGALDEGPSEIMLKRGAAPELNYRALNYRLPRMVIDYGPTSNINDRIIHLPKKLYNDMIGRIRDGKVYTNIVSNVKKVK